MMTKLVVEARPRPFASEKIEIVDNRLPERQCQAIVPPGELQQQEVVQSPSANQQSDELFVVEPPQLGPGAQRAFDQDARLFV